MKIKNKTGSFHATGGDGIKNCNLGVLFNVEWQHSPIVTEGLGAERLIKIQLGVYGLFNPRITATPACNTLPHMWRMAYCHLTSHLILSVSILLF